MRDTNTLSHVTWECKYHIVWVPKYRRKTLYGKIRARCGEIIRQLCNQKGVGLVEGTAKVDHVHVCLSIPPKYSVSHVVGFLKGKSAIRLHCEFPSHRSKGKHFWVRGYYVSTVGLDEEKVCEYIKKQYEMDIKQVEFNFD